VQLPPYGEGRSHHATTASAGLHLFSPTAVSSSNNQLLVDRQLWLHQAVAVQSTTHAMSTAVAATIWAAVRFSC
jgi:hypothetical protein